MHQGSSQFKLRSIRLCVGCSPGALNQRGLAGGLKTPRLSRWGPEGLGDSAAGVSRYLLWSLPKVHRLFPLGIENTPFVVLSLSSPVRLLAIPMDWDRFCPWDPPGKHTGEGLPCPPPGIEPTSPVLAGGFLTVSLLTWYKTNAVCYLSTPSMGSHRVGHDWSDIAASAANCLEMTDKREVNTK